MKPVCTLRSLSRAQKLRLASEACIVGGGLSLVGAVATWASGAWKADKAGTERLGIFVGLWVPSLLLLGSYLTRKADDEAVLEREEVPFFEESM